MDRNPAIRRAVVRGICLATELLRFEYDEEGLVPIVTVHQVWQHAKTNEIWAVRLDHDVLTGVFGPIAVVPSDEVLPDLPYEDHPDDLEWVIRSVENFRIVDAPRRRAA